MACCVKNCTNKLKTNNLKTGEYTNFFKFPKDLKLRNEWIQASGNIESAINFNNARICSVHFDDESFSIRSRKSSEPKQNRRLIRNAIPTLHLPQLDNHNDKQFIVIQRKIFKTPKSHNIIENGIQKDEIEDEQVNSLDKIRQVLLEEQNLYENQLCEKKDAVQKFMSTEREQPSYDEKYEAGQLIKIKIENDFVEEYLYDDETMSESNGEKLICNDKNCDNEKDYIKAEFLYEDENATDEINEILITRKDSIENELDYRKLLKENPHKVCGEIILFEQAVQSLASELLFKCALCYKYFENVSEFVNHMNDDHLKENINSKKSNSNIKDECYDIGLEIDVDNIDDECDKDENNSNQEITQENENITFSSKIKKKSFTSKRPKKQKECKMKCAACKKNFSTQRGLKKHQDICLVIKTYNSKVIEFNESKNEQESTDPLQCRYCGVRYKTRIKCIQHECTHNGIKLYTCEYCQKGFNYKHYFKVHLKIHKGIKPNKCHLCNKSFTRREHLKTHLRRHLNERKYKCDYCQKFFVELSEKKLHERIHTGERPHLCNECGKSFSLKTSLLYHLKIKHTNGTDTTKFTCCDCGKDFKSVLHLSKHKSVMHKIHKELKCTVCSDVFSTKYDLRMHKNLKHSSNNDYKYKCSECDVKYKHYKSLWLHQKNHLSLDKTFSCSICYKQFKQYSSWYHHVKKCRLKCKK